RDHARDALGHHELVAIIHPENSASRRVAEKIGLREAEQDFTGAAEAREAMGLASRTVMAMRL
ncbi:N-acetyltransferase, partial [Micrococcus endophyticus]